MESQKTNKLDPRLSAAYFKINCLEEAVVFLLRHLKEANPLVGSEFENLENMILQSRKSASYNYTQDLLDGRGPNAYHAWLRDQTFEAIPGIHIPKVAQGTTGNSSSHYTLALEVYKKLFNSFPDYSVDLNNVPELPFIDLESRKIPISSGVYRIRRRTYYGSETPLYDPVMAVVLEETQPVISYFSLNSQNGEALPGGYVWVPIEDRWVEVEQTPSQYIEAADFEKELQKILAQYKIPWGDPEGLLSSPAFYREIDSILRKYGIRTGQMDIPFLDALNESGRFNFVVPAPGPTEKMTRVVLEGETPLEDHEIRFYRREISRYYSEPQTTVSLELRWKAQKRVFHFTLDLDGSESQGFTHHHIHTSFDHSNDSWFKFPAHVQKGLQAEFLKDLEARLQLEASNNAAQKDRDDYTPYVDLPSKTTA